MADWVTISSLATAGGTLVLAGATFASVRSANRSARPVRSGRETGRGRSGVAQAADDVVYVAASLRKSGAALLHGWRLVPMTVDVLYGDFEGGQRVVDRADGPRRRRLADRDLAALEHRPRHWNIDRADPR